MKRSISWSHRSILKGAAGITVILVLMGCSQNLVFDNEYDPDADNSPLSTSVTDVYANYYTVDPGNTKTVDFGWRRVPQAISYEYEVVRAPWHEEPISEAFSGNPNFEQQGAVAQTIEGNDPFDTTPLSDGVYATRIRYLATATNNGVTSDVWSPWSSPEKAEIGVPLYYYRTDVLSRGDQYVGRFYTSEKNIFEVDAQADFAAGNPVSVFIEDQYSGYIADDEVPAAEIFNVSVYDAENSFDGSFLFTNANFNKVDNPIQFTMPASERLYIVLDSDEGQYEIRIQY